MGMRPERCATCRFADPDRRHGPLTPPFQYFTCRRRAPVICPEAHVETGRGAEAFATWPGVAASDWCGEWEAAGD